MLKKTLPYILLLLGLVLLLFAGFALPAGMCFMLGFVLIIEYIWPERWNAEKP